MNPRVTVGLLAVLVALGAYIYFGPTPAASPAGPTPATKAAPPQQIELWSVEESQIQSVSVQRGVQTAGVTRAGEEWQVTPSGEMADRLRVNSLMIRLAKVNATYRVPNATNDAEFGLATPSMVATLGLAGGDSRVLTVGGKAPAESGTYVRQGTAPEIYLVSNALVQDLERIVTEPPRPPSPIPSPSPAPSPIP